VNEEESVSRLNGNISRSSAINPPVLEHGNTLMLSNLQHLTNAGGFCHFEQLMCNSDNFRFCPFSR
jgi:hypothetical protein